MMHRLAALGEVCRRHVQVWRMAWGERGALAPMHRTSHELAFLPAHLELTETPLSPAPRVSAWIIMGLFCVAMLWACLGRLDMVAVAPRHDQGGEFPLHALRLHRGRGGKCLARCHPGREARLGVPRQGAHGESDTASGRCSRPFDFGDDADG